MTCWVGYSGCLFIDGFIDQFILKVFRGLNCLNELMDLTVLDLLLDSVSVCCQLIFDKVDWMLLFGIKWIYTTGCVQSR